VQKPLVSAAVLPQKICARLFQCHLAKIYGLSQSLFKMAEGWALRLTRFGAFLSDIPQLKAYFPLP